jgi:hypothetical protein
MSQPRDPDAIIAMWLENGPTDLPDATRRAIATAVPTTSQVRRSRFVSRRLFELTGLGRVAAMAVVAVAVATSALAVFGSLARPGATPSPATQRSASGAPSPGTSIGTVTFASRQYGYEVIMPATWNATSATEAWSGDGDGIEQANPDYVDAFRIEGSPVAAAVRVKARALPDGTTAATWLAQWEASRAVGGLCFGFATPWTDTTVAGLHTRRYEWRCDGSQSEDAKSNYDEYAFVSGRMGYVVTGTPSMAQLLLQSFRAP